jgi:hypothetical protein
MGPRSIDGKLMLKQPDGPRVAGTAQKDHTAVQRRLQVEGESGRDRPPFRACVETWGKPPSTCLDVGIRSRLERGERIVMKPGPNLGLPAPVEILEAILKSVFTGDGEDWRDAEVQTQAHDPADDVGVLMGPLEPRVIIELGEFGQPDLAPMTENDLQCAHGRVRQVGPRANQAAVQGDHVEHFDFGTALQDQALDKIPAVEFRQARSDPRQIPARWWREPTHAVSSIKRPSACEHPINRAERGRWAAFRFQLARNGRGAVLPERTGGFQFLTHLHDARFQLPGDSTDALRPVRSIGPVDAVQTLVAGALECTLHRAQANTKSPGDLTLRGAASDGRNEGTTSCRDLFFVMLPLLMWPPSHRQRESPMEAADLWKQRTLPQGPWKTHRPRFPQLPQGLFFLFVWFRY